MLHDTHQVLENEGEEVPDVREAPISDTQQWTWLLAHQHSPGPQKQLKGFIGVGCEREGKKKKKETD